MALLFGFLSGVLIAFLLHYKKKHKRATQHWSWVLKERGMCQEAYKWASKQDSFFDAWEACPRTDWMISMVGHMRSQPSVCKDLQRYRTRISRLLDDKDSKYAILRDLWISCDYPKSAKFLASMEEIQREVLRATFADINEQWNVWRRDEM